MFSGEKPTGGYSIKVTSVEDIEGITKITAAETEPGENVLVTQALTYPVSLVKFTGTAENFKAFINKGEELKLLSAE